MPIFPLERFSSFSPMGVREHTLLAQCSDKESHSLANKFREVLNKRGVELPLHSRFNAYLNTVDDHSADKNLRIIATQEISQLLLALIFLEDITEWNRTILDAIRYESTIPDPKANQTKARDALFELYVAGRMQSIGISTLHGEPDIVCNKQGFNFVIAAKRIKSQKKLLFRVKEARNQIEKSRLPGIIALDLTQIQSECFGSFETESIDLFLKRSHEFIDKNFEALLPEIEKICKRKHVFGIIAFATIGTQLDNQHTIAISRIHRGHRLCISGSTKAEHMWEIVNHLGKTPSVSI